jgi:lysophospholipase L1-like esterase
VSPLLSLSRRSRLVALSSLVALGVSLPRAGAREAHAPPRPAPIARVATLRRPPAPRTSCRAVAHVGDSTSVGLVSPHFIPDEEEQIPARYGAVGVERFLPEISGGRSMVERLQNQENATEVVERTRAAGFDGCWVLAVGVNDSANTRGDVGKLVARIDTMMAKVGRAPVLWTTSKTLLGAGPYQNENMEAWNQAIASACARYPNVRVYDWASEVQDDWFVGDGIHPNATGFRERAARIAKALAIAFPSTGRPPARCLVRTTP